jgi:hypothetical protein
MQIDIDFEVFKALTALRESESDSFNAVIRRLLGLTPTANALDGLALNALLGGISSERSVGGKPFANTERERKRSGLFGATPTPDHGHSRALTDGLLARYASGAWFNNVHFPEGSRFRATHKGETHFAEIRDRKWVGEDGIERNSPSDAASAITGNNVNGWRFWYVQMPGDPAWRRLEELRL